MALRSCYGGVATRWTWPPNCRSCRYSLARMAAVLSFAKFPDLLLLNLSHVSVLAGVSHFSGQGSVANKPRKRFSKRWYITHGDKKAGLPIHDEIYDPSRQRTYHRFASGVRLQDDRG